MSNVVPMKRAPAAKRSRMDTLMISHDVIANWRLPPFQRPLRVNEKVRQIAEEIRCDGGVIPGVITLGVIEEGRGVGTYIIDGQHRIEAFRISDVKEAIADVRIVTHTSMAEMGQDFVNLNSRLVAFRPDDVLRGLEESTPSLKVIRERCPFIGYGHVRRGGGSSPVLSMSAVIRAWAGSAAETPALNGAAAMLASDMSEESTLQLVDFLSLAFSAWGRGEDASKLWGNLNLSICMWLWRRIVLDTDRTGSKRAIVLKPGQFRNCMMSLGASPDYNEWLVGRNVSDRDRAPCYGRIKVIFVKRLKEDGQERTNLPKPPWDCR